MYQEFKEIVPLPITWQKITAVVLFADLVRFFPRARQLPLDELGEFIKKFYGMCQSEIVRNKGEVVAFIGDGVFGLYKKELCAGMDPEWCATKTAFHLIKQIRKINPELELNVGINQGEMLEGTWEQNGKSHRTVLGDSVNRAALLAGQKLHGINVSRQVINVLGPRVKYEKLSFRFPGDNIEETIYRLTSLDL